MTIKPQKDYGVKRKNLTPIFFKRKRKEKERRQGVFDVSSNSIKKRYSINQRKARRVFDVSGNSIKNR